MTGDATAAPTQATVEARPRGARWRRWPARTLIVLSCVLVPLSVLGIWLRNQVLDTNRYVANVAPLASNPEVINTVAADVTANLFANANVEDEIKGVLPSKASFLAGPLTTG